MDYYGNNDWRDYLAHYGTPRHSGRYPWGSGKNPRQGTVGYYQGKGKALGPGSSGARYGSSSSADKGRVYRDWDEWEKENSKGADLYYYDESSGSYVKKPKNDTSSSSSSAERKPFKQWVKDRIDSIRARSKQQAQDYADYVSGDFDDAPVSKRTADDIRKLIEADSDEETLPKPTNSGRYPWGNHEEGTNEAIDDSKQTSMDKKSQQAQAASDIESNIEVDPHDKVGMRDASGKWVEKDFGEKLSYRQPKVKELPQVKKAFDDLADARKNYRDAHKISEDFNALTQDQLYSYKLKAYRALCNETGERYRPLPKTDTWLMYEDWDQGDTGSFAMYCKDRGTSYDKEWDKHAKAEKVYLNAVKSAVDDLLGNYADEKIKRFKNKNYTVREVVNRALDDLLSDDEYYSDRPYYIHF